MIRIFITTLIYFISHFTQAEEHAKIQEGISYEHHSATINVINLRPPIFDAVKFELSDKDLTFDTNL